MKIALIGPGEIEIPPRGWGATEILIWDVANTLKNKGHKVLITNTKDFSTIVKNVNEFSPDFVHLHHDQHIDVMKYINCKKQAVTSHYGYLDRPKYHPVFRPYPYIFQKFLSYSGNIFCLSPEAMKVYRDAGFDEKRLFLSYNGVNKEKIKYSSTCNSNKSIYLASVEFRKRQYILEDISQDIDFYGVRKDSTMDRFLQYYKGTLFKEEIYTKLTDYANLVLLSDGEGHPLVCMEAMCAGLGLVLSEYACQNLGVDQPFIAVIPENKISDKQYIRNVIDENKRISINMRDKIREYVLSKFDWNVVVDRYIQLIESINT